MTQPNISDYLKRLLLTVGVVGLFVLLAVGLWAIANILLLVFTGVLLAVILRTPAKLLARYTPLTTKWALVVIVMLLLLLVGGGGWLLVPEIANQTDQLGERIGEAVNQLEMTLAQYDWGQRLLEGAQGQQPAKTNILTQLANTFSVTLEGLANLIFTIFIGLFVAADPDLYRSGIISLIPPQGRRRARQVIDGVSSGLRNWLLGQLICMVVIGIVVSIGLSVLGIPLALGLGVVTGLLEFVPVVGPILSVIPAVLVALTLGLMPAIYVALFYLVVQQLEGNLLTPIVQQKVVSLPPAIMLTAVLVMGYLFGPLGVLVATPLAVVLFILVRMLYLQDILGHRPQ